MLWEGKMTADRVREIVAQQRAVEARNQPKCPEGSIGDVVVCVLSSAVIAVSIVNMLIAWWQS
jgi:hypothetical protein